MQQTDIEGITSYSGIVLLNVESTAQVKIFPNPISHQFIISITVPGRYQVSLLDVSGKVLQTNNIIVTQGSSTVSISRGALAAGLYFITIIAASGQSG